MKEIKLNRGYVTIVDNNDYEWLNQWKWNIHVYKTTIYAERHATNKEIESGSIAVIKMHRFILNTPKGIVNDHIDRDGLNNQRFNLRNCTQKQNRNNTKPRLGCKYKGISKKSGRGLGWDALLRFNKVRYYLGYHKTPEDAARAYDKKAIEIFGEFAYLNFPEEWGREKRAS